MKDTYTAPTIIASGNVVRETMLAKSSGSAETLTKFVGAGSVGFYL